MPHQPTNDPFENAFLDRTNTAGSGTTTTVPPPAPEHIPHGATTTVPINVTPPSGSIGTSGLITQAADTEELRRKQLEAAIRSIQATFGGNIASTQAEFDAQQPAFNFTEAQNLRNRGLAITQAQEDANQRGIFRSTITGRNVVRAATPYTEAIAQAQSARGTQEQQFLATIEQLKAQQEAKIEEARLASEADRLQFELYLAQLGI